MASPDESYTSRFDSTLKFLTQDRGIDYGHPLDNFLRIAKMHSVIDQCPDPILAQALKMIAVKITRLVNNPYHFDSWVDIAGYARTACMAIDKMNEEEAYAPEKGTEPRTVDLPLFG